MDNNNKTKTLSIEEKLNSISHGIGAIGALFGLVILIIFSIKSNKDWALFSSVVYGVGLLLTYISSTIYHAISKKKMKHVFRVLDHSSIFILIAGSYTPVLLISIGGNIGWSMFIAQWSIAIFGIIFKIRYTGKYEFISILLYLTMGWMAVFQWDHLINSISEPAFKLLLSGGLAYTIGILFYLFDYKFKYFHFIWHLFVIIASALHYMMILKYVII